MAIVRKQVAIFVDRSSQQWVVRYAYGNFWLLLAGDTPWARHQPFAATEETELEPIPGHYR